MEQKPKEILPPFCVVLVVYAYLIAKENGYLGHKALEDVCKGK